MPTAVHDECFHFQAFCCILVISALVICLSTVNAHTVSGTFVTVKQADVWAYLWFVMSELQSFTADTFNNNMSGSVLCQFRVFL